MSWRRAQARCQGAGDVERDPRPACRRIATHEDSMKRRPKLYLVGQDPTDIFQDLDQLRADLTSPRQRRQRITETFARIPHDKGLALKVSGTAWRVLIELDRLILKAGGQNPIPLSSKRLRAAGLNHYRRTLALRR